MIKKRRSGDAQCWTVNLLNQKRQLPEVFYKNAVLKYFAIFMGKYQGKSLRTPILKNICVRLLLNWLYEVIVWNFVSGSHLKLSRLSNITKIPVAFKALNKVWCNYLLHILTLTLSCKRRFRMFIINGYYTKSERFWSLDSLLKDVLIYCCELFD